MISTPIARPLTAPVIGPVTTARVDGRIGEQRADLHGAAVRNEAGRIGVSGR